MSDDRITIVEGLFNVFMSLLVLSILCLVDGKEKTIRAWDAIISEPRHD